jgi:GT2 family glycosyltransferase
MQPRVLIIVLCYNGVALTVDCLNSLGQLEYERADILVVDNNSSDDTPTIIQSRFPVITLIQTGANLGFAAGNNVGLRYAFDHGYDYAFLLNNDTEVAHSMLAKLLEVAEADSTIGMVGPTIYFYEQPERIWSAGGSIDWHHGTSSMRRLNQIDSDQHQRPEEVDFISGCALLCKRSVIERIGLLDERFFMYYEETEWCVRAKRAGFRIVHVPQARILHKIPLDARADLPYVAYYMTRNRLLFLQATRAGMLAWLHAGLFQDLRTCMSLSVRRKWRSKRGHRDAMLSAWGDFLRQRFGRWEATKA